MSWKSVVAYTFENHAAVDHSKLGHIGQVELPAPDRWIDTPIPQISTAIKYDHPESKITVSPSSEMSSWPGFRVAVLFKPDKFNRRLNLIEGDRSFAFFIESDGRLKGTIYDGSIWYGVETAPGTIKPDIWYSAEYRYDPSTALSLYLDGQLVGFEITHGDPVRSVGPVGIKIGYWPGGDSRYTFLGLLGPITIWKLDPYEETIERFGKFVCGIHKNSNGQQKDIWDTLLNVVRTDMTDQERAQSIKFGNDLIDAAKIIMAGTLGTSSDRNTTLSSLKVLSRRFENLLVQSHENGVNFMEQPEYTKIINETRIIVENSSDTSKSTLMAQVIRLLSGQPLSKVRITQFFEKYPGLKECFEEGKIDFGPNGNPFDDWLDDCIHICPDGKGFKGKDGNGGVSEDNGSTEDCKETKLPDICSRCKSNIHIHVHCKVNKRGGCDQ